MKPKIQSRHVQTVRELLGLAVIGFVLWLAAIGWLPVSSANAAPEGRRHGDQGGRWARIPIQLELADRQVNRTQPIPERPAAKRRARSEPY